MSEPIKQHNIHKYVDPYYIQVSRTDAAKIIGRSPTNFDLLRKTDSRCPKGFRQSTDTMARVLFRLSEVYDYSEQLIQDGIKNNEIVEKKLKKKKEMESA